MLFVQKEPLMLHSSPATHHQFCPHELAKQLRTLRLRKGWNMDRVAAAAGISRTTLHHLERGAVARPRAATLHRLARVLDVPVERLCHEVRSPAFRRNAPPEGGTTNGEHDDDFARRAFDRATNPEVAAV